MKKYLLVFLLCFTSIVSFAQERKYYCETLCDPKLSGGYIVYLDMGDMQGENFSFGKNDKSKPVDRNGKEVKFPSLASVLNWMSERGWKLEIKVEVHGAGEMTVYTFSKITTKDKIKEGINLKGDN